MVSIYIIFSLVTIFSSFMETLGSEGPTVANYFLKELDLLGRENWRYLMTNDTDIDHDGRVSDLEVEYKIHSYLGELFNIMDQDKDSIITEEEMKSPKFEISDFTDKVIDIALENFPVKPSLLAADANGDSFYDEDDFYLPAKLLRQRPKTLQTTTKSRLKHGIPELYTEDDEYFFYKKIAQVGDNEGAVLCRSLGFEGFSRTIEGEEYGYWGSSWSSLVRVSCQGNESRLEDCQLINLQDVYDEYEDGSIFVNYVNCTGEQKLGSLHLIGGKDSSAGDIFFGDKGLGCTPRQYEYIDEKGNLRTEGRGLDELSEVICRELGFPGFIKTTRGSAFTKNIKPDKFTWGDDGPVVQNGRRVGIDEVLRKGLSCIGTEKKVADCEITDGHGQDCDSRSVAGIVCETDTRKAVDEDLANIVGWNYDIWEKFGRFLFIADSNHDKKLTLDEIAGKAKTYVSAILEFLDQTQDGHISIDDFTSLNIKVGPIHRILDLAFDVLANKTSDDIDLLALKIADVSLDEVVGDYLERHDENMDGKLNALDFFGFEERYIKHNLNTKERYLITFLNMKLDKNQDGKLQRLEIKQFVDEIFRQLDTDRSDEITLEDVYQMMQTHGFDCFQIGAFKTFVTITLNTAQTQFAKFMSYLFKLYDLDRNERVTLDEFKKMTVPCDMEESWNNGYDGSPYGCDYLKHEVFLRYFPDFPDLEMKSGRRNKKDEETVADKLANAACQILT